MEGKTYKVVMVAGRVKKDACSGMTLEEAEEFCNAYDWEVAPDGGFVWALDIEEE